MLYSKPQTGKDHDYQAAGLASEDSRFFVLLRLDDWRAPEKVVRKS